jgi:glycine/D-amino acid oxidase-like deaminating enzyme
MTWRIWPEGSEESRSGWKFSRACHSGAGCLVLDCGARRNMESYVVIGGGLAGLTAANELAGQGNQVTLLEQSTHLGGRARTQAENGYLLNLGPHALYRGGWAARTFREWRIPFSGGLPPTASRAYFVREARFYPLVTNLTGLLATRLFNFREKLEVANLLRAFSAAKANPRETMANWLDRHVSSPRVREFAATAIRISTFALDLDRLGAEIALGQIRGALKDNVLYLDGGWQTLVDRLAERARSLGVDIRCDHPVGGIGSIDATKIILAVGPAEVEKLTGVATPAALPLHMASLDLALDGMPEDATNVAFAVDRPLYFSVHSASAQLAPRGGRMVHAAKYLGAELQDSKAVRAELEDYATLVLPAWRKQTRFARFLPALTVTPMMPTSANRPDVDFLGLDRVRIAGDWVGPEGMLADAAVASALRAACAIERRKAAAA